MIAAAKFLGALLLSAVTNGAIDYSPECNRPWVVDFGHKKRYAGRGRTLIEAARHYWK